MQTTFVLRVLVALVTVLTASALLACGSDCEEQSCADFGGEGGRTLQSCYSSGSEGGEDEFWIENDDGDEVYKCTRPAGDNDGCGADLVQAKESYCSE